MDGSEGTGPMIILLLIHIRLPLRLEKGNEGNMRASKTRCVLPFKKCGRFKRDLLVMCASSHLRESPKDI